MNRQSERLAGNRRQLGLALEPRLALLPSERFPCCQRRLHAGAAAAHRLIEARGNSLFIIFEARRKMERLTCRRCGSRIAALGRTSLWLQP